MKATKGCFGSFICHDPTSDLCINCDLFERCAHESTEVLKIVRLESDSTAMTKAIKSVRKRVNRSTASIAELPKISRRIALTDDQLKLVADERWPVKARELTASILRKGFDCETLQKTVRLKLNPFENERPESLRLIMQKIIEGPCRRRHLVSLLMLKTTMKQNTATSMVSLIINSLLMLGLIEENKETGTVEIIN